MVLTEKVRQEVGGKAFRVFEVAGVSVAITYTITVDQLGLHHVDWATYSPKTCVLSAGSTTYPKLTVAESSAGGTAIVLSAHAVSGENGTLTVWGW